jgi:hypothetical protein
MLKIKNAVWMANNKMPKYTKASYYDLMFSLLWKGK